MTSEWPGDPVSDVRARALIALVQVLIPVMRVSAGARGELRTEDFRYGESSGVPDRVRIPNRNYMNLLEFRIVAASS